MEKAIKLVEYAFVGIGFICVVPLGFLCCDLYPPLERVFEFIIKAIVILILSFICLLVLAAIGAVGANLFFI